MRLEQFCTLFYIIHFLFSHWFILFQRHEMILYHIQYSNFYVSFYLPLISDLVSLALAQEA